MNKYKNTQNQKIDLAVDKGAIFALRCTPCIIAVLLSYIFQGAAHPVIVVALSCLSAFFGVFSLCLIGAILNGALE